MLSIRNHFPASPTVSVDDEEYGTTIVVEAADTIIRTHLKGRMKGTVEHTVIRLHFSSRAEAVDWLTTALEGCQ